MLDSVGYEMATPSPIYSGGYFTVIQKQVLLKPGTGQPRADDVPWCARASPPTGPHPVDE